MSLAKEFEHDPGRNGKVRRERLQVAEDGMAGSGELTGKEAAAHLLGKIRWRCVADQCWNRKTPLVLSSSSRQHRPGFASLLRSEGRAMVFILALLLCSGATAQNMTSNSTAVPTVLASTSVPTLAPVLNSTVAPSFRPSGMPSFLPSGMPSFRPTSVVSANPSVSAAPTRSHIPSYEPSQIPSFMPSLSDPPSLVPTTEPTAAPITAEPTSYPTFTQVSESLSSFRQDMTVSANSTFFNETEQRLVAELYASYTFNFSGYEPPAVNTSCVVTNQNFDVGSDEIKTLTLDFDCVWASKIVSVLTYPISLRDFINENTTAVTEDLQTRQLDVFEAMNVRILIEKTDSPTTSAHPTMAPTARPTFSASPSLRPSAVPSLQPTLVVSASPSTPLPSMAPSTSDPTKAPTRPPTPTSNGPDTSVIIGVVLAVGIVGLAAIGGLYCLIKRRQKEKRRLALSQDEERASDHQGTATGLYVSSNAANRRGGPEGMSSPSESILTKGSLISAGESGLGNESGDENDGTGHLQDEFDEFKNRAIEEFRSKVEGGIEGLENDLSKIVTEELIDPDDSNINPTELLWGCEENANGVEIEASVLCEVSDWLSKRKEPISDQSKRVFTKEILNRMVTSVRLGVIKAEDASRTIHEAGALLGLPLANELPMTTVIVSGMRLSITASQMVTVLREFGDIDVAAVASGARGFGIIRYRNSQSVDRALHRYHKGGIVVQDVAVHMRVLKPSGAVET